MSADPAAQERIEEVMIRRARESFERLPTLEMVVDRMILSLATELKAYTSVMPDIALDAFDYVSSEEAMTMFPSPCMVAVVASDPWKAHIGCGVEPDLLFTILELMLGGRSSRSPEWVPRSFTAIEKAIGQKIVELALTSLEGSFANVTSVRFQTEVIETMPKSVVLAPPTTPSVRVRVKVSFEGRAGHLTIVIPHGGFEEVRALLAQPYLGGRIGGDSGWRRQLGAQITGSDVTLTAVLTELSVPLRKVLDWQPGQVLDLGVTAEQPITAVVQEQPMFRATLGQRANGSLALRISETLIDLSEDPDASDAD